MSEISVSSSAENVLNLASFFNTTNQSSIAAPTKSRLCNCRFCVARRAYRLNHNMTLEKISVDELKDLCGSHNVPVKFLPYRKDLPDAIIDGKCKVELKNWQAQQYPLSPKQYYDKVLRRQPDVVFATDNLQVSSNVSIQLRHTRCR